MHPAGGECSKIARLEGEIVAPTLRLGFVGLGIMGRPMARNLLKAGFLVTVYNRSRASVDELAREGAAPAANAAETAAGADAVITMVRDAADVAEVIAGPAGILAGARPGLMVIEMSTIDPETSRRMAAACAERGVRYVDAPVSGGEQGAQQGALSIMAGGEMADVEAARPIFAVLGKTVVHVGEAGMGHTVKLCNQIICGLNLLAAAEGLAFARAAGADPAKVLEVVTAGAAGSWMLSRLGPKMVEHDLKPGFTVALQQKDLRLAQAAAEALTFPLPGTALVQQMFRIVEAQGGAAWGTQAIVRALEVLSSRV